MNNEQIGISAEIAIADTFRIAINGSYRNRGIEQIVSKTALLIPDLFEKHQIPKPVTHAAERQNPVDFKLEGNKTLSVKTNIGSLGKVAPQNIGQPSSSTYFEHFGDIVDLMYRRIIQIG